MNSELDCEICQRKVIVYLKTKRKNIYCPKCVNQNRLKRQLHSLEIEASLLLKVNKYNQDLYKLYLDYTKRYYLKPCLIKQAHDLLIYLSSTSISPMSTWEKVYLESKKYGEKYKITMGLTGSPFVKIGKMLVELGVLPPKSEDYSQYYLRVFSKFTNEKIDTMESFAKFKKNKNTSDKSIILSLERILAFHLWSDVDLFLINQNDIQNYIIYMQSNSKTQHHVVSVYSVLYIFYKWCKFEKIVLSNPLEGIKISRPIRKVIVCDDHTIRKLMGFIQNQESNPEQAFLLTLILIWGLKSEDLSHAKIDITNNIFKIILRRKKLSNIKYYNQKQILHLPQSPEWFFTLQKKFYSKWAIQYGQRKKSCPNYYLMLPRYRSVQTLSKGTIKARVFEATTAAVGKKIPLSVLRKTCGHLHSTSSDASILSTLGWARESSFKYTWMPRVFF